MRRGVTLRAGVPVLSIVVVLLAGVRPPLARAAEVSVAAADDAELYRCRKHAKSARIKITLKPETTLGELVAWVSGFTCKTFLYGTGVTARGQKVTIVSPAEMSSDEGYRLFLASLWTMGLTIVPKGKALEIVETGKAREAAVPIYQGKDAPAHDQLVRAIIRPTHLSTSDLATVLGPLKSQYGELVDVASAGVVIVSDSGSTIAQMMELTASLDRDRRGRVFRIALAHADAEVLAPQLTALLDDGTKATTGKGTATAAAFKLVADTRSNSLLVVGSEELYLDVLALARGLDVELGDGEARAHIVRLENGDAEELAGILNGAMGGSGGAGTAAATATASTTRGTQGASGGTTRGAAAMPASGAVRVGFAKSLNALVVVASERDFRALRQVIRELDVRRRQVFVEATILEVSAERASAIGMAFHGATQFEATGDATVVLGLQHEQFGTVTNAQAQAALSGFALGLLGPQMSLFGTTIPSIGAVFQLVQSSSDVNLRSSPHLLTSDNEEAEIGIGENVPYKSTLATATATAYAQPAQVQRENLELKLKIKPHIGEAGDVRLEIALDIKDLSHKDFEGLGPTWTTRTVKTSIVVKDQQPIVIGGLISERETDDRSQVPLLGDLPLIGALFRYHSPSRSKRNLMIFIVPYIVSDDGDAQVLFDRKMAERREFVETWTAFKAWAYSPTVDYRKKRGLLAEINEQVRQREAESAARREDEADVPPLDGPIGRLVVANQVTSGAPRRAGSRKSPTGCAACR